MSIGDADLLLIVQPEEINPTSSRQSKVSYTRESLLSFSDLEICKRLPKGFNESLLSEFGSSPVQGFIRNDYSSSPPGKGESGNFSRGLNRWDSHASGRSDSEAQSDRDSDSGKRYASQFRRSWQNPEHDGLLGSGSFPRPPGYRPSASVPSFRANDQHLLKKSSEPYHPPHPFKASPHSRRETKDSYNHETFGLTESSSEDRVEEERKRRAEFEMMRKEQHKELQEKLKSKAKDKLKVDHLTELAASLDTEDDAIISNGLDTSLMKPLQLNDSGKSSISSQGQPLRPVVPPGFTKAATEKIFGPKSMEHPSPFEHGNLELGHANKDEKPVPMALGDNYCETTSLLASKGGTKGHLSSFESSSKTIDPADQSFRDPNISEISEILHGVNVSIESEKFNRHKIIGETGHSTSILEKFFGAAVSMNSTGPPKVIEDKNTKKNDVWSPRDPLLQTSKFAHMFHEEEKKMPESGSLGKSNELLSLIVGDKSGLLASEAVPAQQSLPLESGIVKLTTSAPNNAGIYEVPYNNNKPQSISAFLTCEDLEQSILSNVRESSSSSQPRGMISSEHGMKDETHKADIDKNASQHLLSLLQTGISSNSKTMPLISMLGKCFPIEPQDMGGEGISEVQGDATDRDADNLHSGKGLTLETLFGTAFMKELHSADAPASIQRNSSLSSSSDVSEHSMRPLVVSDNGALASSVNDARFKRLNKDDYILQWGGGQQTNMAQRVGVNWLIADGSHTETELPNLASLGMRLPEEDTSGGLSAQSQSSMYSNDLYVTYAEMFPSSSNPPADIAEKIAALGVSMRHERPVSQKQDFPPFLRSDPFDMVKPEIPHPIMHPQSSPQFNPAPMNHIMPIFQPLDPHSAPIDPQFNYMPQDAPIHHQFPANQGHHGLYRHPSTGVSEFDHPIHPMLQQEHMPNNIPSSSHVLAGYPGSNPPVYIQEHNPIHGFPFGQQQPSFGGRGIPLAGPEHGDTNSQRPPQTLQRLLEMELRSNQKRMHHPTSAGHSRTQAGHELDTALWYR